VFFTERLVAQNNTTATASNRAEKPKSAVLTWCFGGLVAGDTDATVAGVAAFKLTVVSFVPCRGKPPGLLNRAVAVPGWTLLDCVPPVAPCPADCGVWVVDCTPEPVPVVSWFVAIDTIVKQSPE
jgi:hypothetical protein